jgi:hypothetical protein
MTCITSNLKETDRRIRQRALISIVTGSQPAYKECCRAIYLAATCRGETECMVNALSIQATGPALNEHDHADERDEDRNPDKQ